MLAKDSKRLIDRVCLKLKKLNRENLKCQILVKMNLLTTPLTQDIK